MAWFDNFWRSSEIIWQLTGGLFDKSTPGQALSAFMEPLVGALISILYLVIYPVISILAVIQFFLEDIINTLITFFNSIIYLFNDLGYFVNVFDGVFPSTWLTLLSLIILVNLGLRIYYYVKGISIFGWSIG